MFVSPRVLFVFSTFVVAAFGIQSRISGGVVAAAGSSPWLGSIQVGLLNPVHICGGNIISDHYVITAGHCGYALIGSITGIVAIYIRVGSNHLTSGGQRYRIYYVYLHPEFHNPTGYANIALLTTEEPIIFNDLVAPIPLRTEAPLSQAPVSTAGWGALLQGSVTSEQLHSLETYSISYSDCQFLATHAAQAQGINIPDIYEEKEICTFHSVGTGSCQGDQGNGLVDADGSLIGVLSWAFPCGSGGPEVFTRIDFYVPWIESVMN